MTLSNGQKYPSNILGSIRGILVLSSCMVSSPQHSGQAIRYWHRITLSPALAVWDPQREQVHERPRYLRCPEESSMRNIKTIRSPDSASLLKIILLVFRKTIYLSIALLTVILLMRLRKYLVSQIVSTQKSYIVTSRKVRFEGVRPGDAYRGRKENL